MSSVINRIESSGESYDPRIYRLSRHTANNQTQGQNKAYRRIKVVIPTGLDDSETDKALPEKYIKREQDLSRNQFITNVGLLTGTLTASALAAGSYLTDILDRFEGSTKKLIQLGLDACAIGLLTITANGIFGNQQK